MPSTRSLDLRDPGVGAERFDAAGLGAVPVRYFSVVPKAITLPMKSPGNATSMSMIGSSNRTSADVAPLRMAVLAAISKPTALEPISW